MNQHVLIAVAAGLAIGYFAAATLAEHQPFAFAYQQGAKFGAPAA